MINNDPFQNLLDRLPENIDGYQRRVLTLGYIVIEYSKKPMFGRYPKPELFSEKDLEENLLFDVKADTIEDAVAEMKVKVQKYRKNNLD